MRAAFYETDKSGRLNQSRPIDERVVAVEKISDRLSFSCRRDKKGLMAGLTTSTPIIPVVMFHLAPSMGGRTKPLRHQQELFRRTAGAKIAERIAKGLAAPDSAPGHRALICTSAAKGERAVRQTSSESWGRARGGDLLFPDGRD